MNRFESVPRSPYAEKSPDERLIREVCEIRTVDVSPSDQIGYTLLNRHLIGEECPVVAVGGFLSDLTTVERAWEGIHLAELHRPILMLDMPGHGLSSPHGFRQTYDLCVRRRVDSQARPMTEAVQKTLQPEDQIDYFGISHGALLSLKMTEQDPEDRVGNVFSIDLPAVKKRWTLGMQLGYVVIDSLIGRKRYFEEIKHNPCSRDFEAFEREFSELDVEKADSFIKSNPGLFLCNLVASVGARPVAIETLRRIMEEKSASVKVMTAERSSVSDYRAIEAFIGSLSPEHRQRCRQTVVEDEDHNIGRCQLMPRSVAYAKEAYDS